MRKTAWFGSAKNECRSTVLHATNMYSTRTINASFLLAPIEFTLINNYYIFTDPLPRGRHIRGLWRSQVNIFSEVSEDNLKWDMRDWNPGNFLKMFFFVFIPYSLPLMTDGGLKAQCHEYFCLWIFSTSPELLKKWVFKSFRMRV